jgi:RND family efflux transporter MFP subunit
MPLVTLEQEEFQLAIDQASAQLEQARAAVGLEPGDPLEDLNPENAPPVREVQAVWDEARTKSERWQQLARQNAVTEADLQAVLAAEQVAEAQYASALNGVREKIALIHVRAAELALAEQRLADTVVPAPFDGLVQQRNVAPGTFVQIGSAICAVVRTDPLHFRGMMPERHARKLTLGQAATLQVESVDEPRTAHVSRISPTLDPLSRSLLFEVELANADHRLRTGLFAEAAVTLDEATTALAVPESAIIEFAGVEKVWKLTDGTAGEQVVVTGARRDGLVEIVHGLTSGDRILRHGSEGRVARIEEIARPAAVTADTLPAETEVPEVDVTLSQPTGSEGAGDETADTSVTDPDEPANEGTGGP